MYLKQERAQGTSRKNEKRKSKVKLFGPFRKPEQKKTLTKGVKRKKRKIVKRWGKKEQGKKEKYLIR